LQVELSKSVGDFFSSPLKSNQVARRSDNIRLPTESVVLVNNDFQTARTDLLGDHIGKLACRPGFLEHGNSPKFNSAKQSGQKNLKDPSKNMVDGGQ
jgi:hypothetical protein